MLQGFHPTAMRTSWAFGDSVPVSQETLALVPFSVLGEDVTADL